MVLKTVGITKKFGAMYALKDVSIDIVPGEFHALVGENGAGKSTLIKILSGVYSLDSGEIIWNGEAVSIANPRQSRELGINVIHQDRHLVPAFNGIENVYLGLDYPRKGFLVDWKAMRRRVYALMDGLGIHIPLDKPASALTPPQKTQLEIVRAMMTDCKLLILDEPTASLTDQEASQLFKIIETLQQRKTAILYVSHRMDEVLAMSNRITVLKNGTFVATVDAKTTNKDNIISLMTDNWSKDAADEGVRTFGETLLEVDNISSEDGIVRAASFKVRAGEILGLFGLGGSGRTETLECVYGFRPKKSGSVKLLGEEHRRLSPRGSIDNGMVIISEDRRGKALVPSLSVRDNTVLSVLDSYGKFGVVSAKAEDADTLEKIYALSIKTEGADQPVAELSGGNQQKVVFAKALMSKPRVILCDEPTQAVDVKTRHEIHNLLRDMAAQGAAVVFVSSDLQELLEVVDTMQIISQGRTKEFMENKGLTAETVLNYCYE